MRASWPCPRCNFLTLNEPAMYELCPVCFWEDDPYQTANPVSSDGANGVSLAEARSSYLRIGAMDPVFMTKVRAPTADKLREREQRRLES